MAAVGDWQPCEVCISTIVSDIPEVYGKSEQKFNWRASIQVRILTDTDKYSEEALIKHRSRESHVISIQQRSYAEAAAS